MKKITKISLALIALIAIMTSCSMERTGYNFQWKNNVAKNETPSSVKQIETKISEAVSEINMIAEENNQQNEISTPAETITITKSDNNSIYASSNKNFLNTETKNSDIQKLAITTKAKDVKSQARKFIKAAKKSALADDVPILLLYLLCFFIPFVAVGIVTNWELVPVISNLLWCCLCGIPGIIHALIKVSQN